MIRYPTLEHRFVAQFPDNLEPGLLYVSFEYGSVAHRCCCGCGEEIVTPLGPTDWHIIYDGEAISLKPSVGNWTLPCRSHYVIRRGVVTEAPAWSETQVAAERRRDQSAKARYFGTQNAMNGDQVAVTTVAEELVPEAPAANWMERIRSWWRNRK